MPFFQRIDFVNVIVSLCIVLVSTVLHEVAHAAAANALGDPTAKERGRLSLNPLVHLHPVGSILLPLLMAIAGGPIFAFANPVPYNPNRLRNPIRDEVLVALAGPACNLVQAIVGAVAFRILYGIALSQPASFEAFVFVLSVLRSYVYLNLMLMFFNLIPLPPLDGSAIISPFLRGKARDTYYQIQRYSMPILLAVMYLLPTILHFNPLSWYLTATAGNLSDLLLGL